MKVRLLIIVAVVAIFTGFYLITTTRKPTKESQNDIIKITPQSSPVKEFIPYESEFISLVQSNKEKILKESGTAAVDISPVQIIKPKGFRKGVYMAVFGYVGENGTNIPTEGGFRFVGVVEGKATMADTYDDNYCNWLRTSEIGDHDRAYLGYENCANPDNPQQQTIELFKGSDIVIKVKNPYSLETPDEYIFTFDYDRRTSDIIKLLPLEHSENRDYKEGIQIERSGIILTVEPAFEGQLVTYDEIKPDKVTLYSKGLSAKPIERIFQNNVVAYRYVSFYSEICNQSKPNPVACHMSNLSIDENVTNSGLNVYCYAVSGKEFNCDEIVKSLIVKVKKL